MRIISFLILVLLCVHPLFAYTVVLKSGKRIDGTFVAEDSITLQMKDSRGVILSIKRELLDLEATVRENSRSEAVPLPDNKDTIVARTPAREIDLVAFAEQTKKSRRGKTRTVTAADLDSATELTIMGTEGELPPVEIERNSDREEQRWRSEAVTLRKEIARSRERRISAEASCEEAEQRLLEKRTRPSRQPVPLLRSFQTPTECERLVEIDRQLAEAQTRLENFEERARRSEIPWQWIE